MEKYYFNARGSSPHEECIEKCMVINGETMIGSVACQECQYCINSDADEWGCSWIICSRIEEATKKSTHDQQN